MNQKQPLMDKSLGCALPVVIAEIGCNHMGDMTIASQLIESASRFCQAPVVKFQKRTPRELLNQEEFDLPHPNERHAFGKSYGEHREFLELGVADHIRLKAMCESFGIIYSVSVWDMTAAREMTALAPVYLKVPSASNTNFEMLEFLCESFSGPIHVSLGMTRRAEEEAIFDLFARHNRNQDLVFYACTSAYPVPDNQACLLEIERLKNQYGNVIKGVGYSGHHNGIALDVAAHVLGAQYIERHFTLDRTWKGTDHAASLEPDGLRRVVRDLKSVADALTCKEEEILEIEKPQLAKLKSNRSRVMTQHQKAERKS